MELRVNLKAVPAESHRPQSPQKLAVIFHDFNETAKLRHFSTNSPIDRVRFNEFPSAIISRVSSRLAPLFLPRRGVSRAAPRETRYMGGCSANFKLREKTAGAREIQALSRDTAPRVAQLLSAAMGVGWEITGLEGDGDRKAKRQSERFGGIRKTVRRFHSDRWNGDHFGFRGWRALRLLSFPILFLLGSFYGSFATRASNSHHPLAKVGEL